MFKRVIYENGSLIIAIAAFACTAIIYSVMVIRAMMMRKDRRDQMANLPLEDGQPPNDKNS